MLHSLGYYYSDVEYATTGVSNMSDMREELTQLILQQTRANKLTVVEEMLVQMMVDKFAEYDIAKTAIQEDGLITTSDGRHGEIKKSHPAISASDLSMKAVLLLAKELGIAPHTMSVHDTKVSTDAGKNPFAKPRPGSDG